MRAAVFVLVLSAAALAGWFLLPHPVPRFGPPIVVDGKRITEEELQRWLVYGPCRAKLEARKTWFLIESERARLARRTAQVELERRAVEHPFATDADRDQALGAARSAAYARLVEETTIGDEALELEYARAVEAFLRANPALNLEAEIGRTYRRSDWFRAELRLGLAFDTLFFPTAPAEWPEETWEALEHQELSMRDARDLSRRSVRELLAGRDWRELRREDPDALSAMRDAVRSHLARKAGFETSIEGLPVGAVLAAHGDDETCPDLFVRTSELWSEVEDSVEPWEIDAARVWLTTEAAVRAALVRDGARELESVHDRLVSDLRVRTEQSGVELDELASADRFPSSEAWVEYLALRESFQLSVAKEALPNEATELALRVARSSWIHGGGRVHVEILLASAADIAQHRWLPNGFERARAKAEELARRIAANDAAWKARRPGDATSAVEPFVFWNRLLDEESEWWDPPDPRAGENPRPPRNHGRFYGRTWSELRTLLSESDATDWSRGPSITEHVAFTQTPGTIAGPFRCALGYVLVRLGARQEPERKLDPTKPADRDALVDDELRELFVRYAREARRRFAPDVVVD